MTKTKFSDVLEAYEFCAASSFGDAEAFISLERGTVHIVSSDYELDEEPPVDLESGPYLAIPDKLELGLGSTLAIKFAAAHLPMDVDTVAEYFRKPGAYGKFKVFLERKGLLQAWYDHEASTKETRLRDWCAANAIELL
ncbi:hypothetical protein [Niveibacterium sp. COAC-50]|uniref:hypothetical protein n=1 Tax=Niveibacterium sp. COAC-50 TaxID=2729384 RepID=UPI001554668E|nr:hypothetical protein [Niveibacterium sp. COAC-50]